MGWNRRLGVALVVAFLWGGVAAAEEGAATAVVEIGHVPADSLAVPSPVGALMRSVVLPGWGQYYNGRPYKAVMFGGAAAGFAATAVGEMGGPAGETLQEIDDRAARRNTRFLYLIGAVTFAALDAFVDAHLADVEIEPIVGMDGEAALLQVRWHW